MNSIEKRKRRLVDVVEQLAPIWRDLALKIHAYPEVALEEHQASLWLSNALKDAGFHVIRGAAGMETSFVALKETNIDAPIIAFLAEYDALPGLGHACGHNLSGAASCLAAHALVNAEKDTDLRIRVLGTPGEEDENAAGKVRMIEHGVLDDVEFALMAHTGFMNLPNRDMLARRNISIDFSVNKTHQDMGEGNALEAVLMTFNALLGIRQKLPSRAQVDGVIVDGGKIVKNKADYSHAQAKFIIRASRMTHLDELESQLHFEANKAANATATTLKWSSSWGRYLPMKRNPAFEAAYKNNLKFLGIEIGIFPADAPIGSTDCGNVSQILPCIHPYFKVAPRNVEHHTPAFTETSGSETGLAAMVNVAKAMALTALDILTDQKLRARITDEQSK